jgi:hypothetical protein
VERELLGVVEIVVVLAFSGRMAATNQQAGGASLRRWRTGFSSRRNEETAARNPRTTVASARLRFGELE